MLKEKNEKGEIESDNRRKLNVSTGRLAPGNLQLAFGIWQLVNERAHSQLVP